MKCWGESEYGQVVGFLILVESRRSRTAPASSTSGGSAVLGLDPDPERRTILLGQEHDRAIRGLVLIDQTPPIGVEDLQIVGLDLAARAG